MFGAIEPCAWTVIQSECKFRSLTPIRFAAHKRDSDGWTLAYCKGPDKLEFNQVLLRAKTVFDRARQERQNP